MVIPIPSVKAARELIHEAKMAKLVPADAVGVKADYPEWAQAEWERSYNVVAANLVPARKPRTNDGKGRKVSAVAVKPGETLYAVEAIESFGRGRGQRIEAGTQCVVQDVTRDSVGYKLDLLFFNEDGESVRGYLYETFKLRYLPAAASNNDVEEVQ